MDYLAFDEGRTELGTNGLPATCRFLLSTKPCSGAGAHAAGSTLAGGVGEITGTGYSRKNQARPAGAAGVFTFAEMSWLNGAAVDWPAGVKSCVLVTSADNSGKAIAAWNLQPGGAARDMSQANTTESFTPTLSITSA